MLAIWAVVFLTMQIIHPPLPLQGDAPIQQKILYVLLAILRDKRVYNLLLSMLLLNVPILIYRYGIKGTPLPPEKAKRVASWYGFIAFIVMMVVSSLLLRNGTGLIAVPILGYLNYLILKRGYVEEVPEIPYVDTAPSPAPNYRTCTKCNALASLDSLYCPVCGAKTTKDAV